MSKRLEITPKIAAAIARSTDSSVDPNTVAVFETGALNTLPISKKGTLFDGGRVTETTLREMADYLNNGTNYAPLHVVHDQGDGALPVGRVFAGEVVNNEGIAELRNLFYLPLDTGAELISKLDTSVIDEVSVGLRTKHITCSECGFDYLGAEATWEHIYYRTCPNEHELGVNGVHTVSSGLDKYMELSLVSRGAASKTRIYPRAKSLLGEDSYKKLAASGVQPEATILFASPTQPTKKDKPAMDMEKLIGDLTDIKASVKVKDQELTAANTTITDLKAKVTTLEGEVTTLKANADVTKVTGLEAQVTALTTEKDAALSFVRSEAERLAVAAGTEKPAADANLETLKASIESSRTKLNATLPVGGRAKDPHADLSDTAPQAYTQSFKTR
jgi:hypothetical protein